MGIPYGGYALQARVSRAIKAFGAKESTYFEDFCFRRKEEERMGIDDNSIRLSPTVNPICASLSHWKATRHGYHNMQRPSFPAS